MASLTNSLLASAVSILESHSDSLRPWELVERANAYITDAFEGRCNSARGFAYTLPSLRRRLHTIVHSSFTNCILSVLLVLHLCVPFTISLPALPYVFSSLYVVHLSCFCYTSPSRFLSSPRLVFASVFTAISYVSYTTVPFIFITLHVPLWDVSLTVIRTVMSLGELLGFLCILLLTYALVGVRIFQGMYPNDFSNSGNFDDIPSALVTLFVLLTTENYPEILEPVSSLEYSVIYYVSFFLILVLFVMSGVVASFVDAYRGIIITRAKKECDKESLALAVAFLLLVRADAYPDSIILSSSSKLDRFFVNRILHIRCMERLYDCSGLPSSIKFPQFVQICHDIRLSETHKSILPTLTGSTLCRRAVDIVYTDYVSLILVIIYGALLCGNVDSTVLLIPLGFQGVELTIRNFAFVPKLQAFDFIDSMFVYLPILFCAVLVPLNRTTAVEVVLCAPILRLTTMYGRLKYNDNDDVSHTMYVFSVYVPLLYKFSCLIVFVFYTFAAVGVDLYSDIVLPNSSDLDLGFSQNSFNDLPHAFLTLFQVFTTSNWHEVMFPVIRATSRWSSLYFVSFVFIIVIITVNLLIALFSDALAADRSVGSKLEESELSFVSTSTGEVLMRSPEATFMSSRNLAHPPPMQKWGSFNWRAVAHVATESAKLRSGPITITDKDSTAKRRWKTAAQTVIQHNRSTQSMSYTDEENC